MTTEAKNLLTNSNSKNDSAESRRLKHPNFPRAPGLLISLCDLGHGGSNQNYRRD